MPVRTWLAGRDGGDRHPGAFEVSLQGGGRFLQQPDVVWAVPGDNLGGEAVMDAPHLASVTRQLIPA